MRTMEPVRSAEKRVVASRRPARRRRAARTIATYVACVVVSLVFVGPFLWMLSSSLKGLDDIYAYPPKLLPSHFHWSNYTEAWHALPFGRFFLNSLIVSGTTTFGAVLTSSMAGYAFARLRFPGREFIFMLFLAVMMVPSQMFLIPQYQLMQGWGLLNTITALALPGMFSAFGTFLMRQFFMQLPVELEEAARLDGANPWQIYWKIMLPLAAPGMLALGLLVAIWSWNDLLWPLVVNTDPEKMPLSAGLANLKGEHLTNYPVLMAGSLMASLPLIVAFIVFQKQLIQGIATTGSKG